MAVHIHYRKNGQTTIRATGKDAQAIYEAMKRSIDPPKTQDNTEPGIIERNSDED